MTLTIGSLFAGIGGFDLGFERAGFKTLWQCEIDKAAQGVLRRHFPEAALHSDVCEVGAANLEPVNVVTFGSPCQDLSVAGKRAGLAGGRSGLFHEAARVIRELRERYGKPDFAIWENVPGAFSSNEGRDFAAVVQTMVDIGACDIAWRVLDSRYFGVAQRRRRVFLVADFGGERAEQVLFEPESLRGDPAKGRKARKETAANAGAGAQDGGSGVGTFFNQGFCKFDENPVGGTLSARDYKSPNQLLVGTLAPSLLDAPDKAACLETTSNDYSRSDGFCAVAFAQNTRDEVRLVNGDGQLVGALAAQPGMKQTTYVAQQPIAFHPTQDPISSTNGVSHTMSNGSKGGTATVAVAVCATGEVTHALTASDGATEDGTGRGTPRAAFLPMQVRRLTTTECEKLQGFPHNHTSEIVTPDGKIKPQADAPRYKQLGNAVTVNVAEWIARRLAATMQPPKETLNG